MRRILTVILISFVLSGVVQAQIMEDGTPVYLGGGQGLRIDLPLQVGRAYTIKLKYGTFLPDAVFTLTLTAVEPGGTVVELASVQGSASPGEWEEISLNTEAITAGPLRWELLLRAEPEGRYFWRDLSVGPRSEAQSSAAKWSEKIDKEGPFYTGLVIDARHLDVRRGISPRIYSESGLLIYGGVLAPQDYVQERGIVAYGTELTPELLRRLDLEGDLDYNAPLIIKATGVAGPSKTGVYISDEDAERVLAAMVQYDFLARYAVIFLVN